MVGGDGIAFTRVEETADGEVVAAADSCPMGAINVIASTKEAR